jgi:hypothetical protein
LIAFACHHFQRDGLFFQFLSLVFTFKFYTQLMIPIKGFGFFVVRARALVDFAVVLDDLLSSLLDPVSFPAVR